MHCCYFWMDFYKQFVKDFNLKKYKNKSTQTVFINDDSYEWIN